MRSLKKGRIYFEKVVDNQKNACYDKSRAEGTATKDMCPDSSVGRARD